MAVTKLACRTAKIAEPARYRSALAKPKNKRGAQSENNPPKVTLQLMVFQPFTWRTVFAG